MSLIDSIYGFQTGVYTMTRRAHGSFVDGVYVPSTTVQTFQIRGVVQPAIEIQRVTGGRDMREREQNQQVDDVQIIHTDTEIRGVTATSDAEIITLEDGTNWVVTRAEKWPWDGLFFWKAVLTRETNGGQ